MTSYGDHFLEGIMYGSAQMDDYIKCYLMSLLKVKSFDWSEFLQSVPGSAEICRWCPHRQRDKAEISNTIRNLQRLKIRF